jgi:Sec-independent protein translocase protein TatA
MESDILNILIAALVMIAAVIVVIVISMKIRKTGGSLTTLMYGATAEFYNKEKQNAIEYVIEEKASKKKETDPSGEKTN